jgi:hypothetical protein
VAGEICRPFTESALAILEREWSNKDVGVRSFAIVALLGMLASVIGLNVVIASLIGVLLLIAARWSATTKTPKVYGMASLRRLNKCRVLSQLATLCNAHPGSSPTRVFLTPENRLCLVPYFHLSILSTRCRRRL